MDEHRANLNLTERLLLALCRAPEDSDHYMGGVDYPAGTELKRLVELFPGFEAAIRDRVVIDFGSGRGYQSLGCGKAGAAQVYGVENDESSLVHAKALLARHAGLEDRIRFVPAIPDDLRADVIFSQNAFEHFLEPERILGQMRAALAPGGRIFIGFGPPWYAPRGAHMSYFCRIPWVQLVFSEKTIMKIRSCYRSDGYTTYRQAGLGELSVGRFEKLIRDSGLQCVRMQYDCVKRLNFLGKTPLRELFINYVRCELVQADRSDN